MISRGRGARRNFRQDGNDQIHTTKRFWVFGNLSRWIRPGAVRQVHVVPR